MRLTFICIFVCVCIALVSCGEEDDGCVGSSLAAAECDPYCEKKFSCGITLPTDEPASYYLELCKTDCVNDLACSGSVEMFDVEAKCCVLDCDDTVACADWGECCNSCS